MTKPDDSHLSLPALRFLSTPAGETLLLQAAAVDPHRPADLARLRRHHAIDLVHAALTIVATTRRALAPRGKFAPLAAPEATFFAPPEALEQATSLRVAWHKARQLRRSGLLPMALVDLAAGVGGDSLGFAQALPVIAVELSMVRAWCLARNKNLMPARFPILAVCADAAGLPINPSGLVFHLDPARRSAGRRHHAYADLIPGPEVIDHLLKQFAGGILKLSPGVEFSDLPPGHLELISEGGIAVQAVLWTGSLGYAPPDLRTVTILPATDDAAADIERGYSLTARPMPEPPPAPPRAYLYEVDPAVHRAGLAPALAAELNCAAVNDDAGYLTAQDKIDHPALRRFAVHTTVAWSESRVAAALIQLSPTTASASPSAPIEVKTRGHLGFDTDKLQKKFSRLARGLTVLIYAANGQRRATLATRAAPA